MKHPSFSDIEYARRKRMTKHEEFLRIMDASIPWSEWISYNVPSYPSGKRGCPPMGIEKMVQIYLLQCWFSLSDEGFEDAISGSSAICVRSGVSTFLTIRFPTPQYAQVLAFVGKAKHRQHIF